MKKYFSLTVLAIMLAVFLFPGGALSFDRGVDYIVREKAGWSGIHIGIEDENTPYTGVEKYDAYIGTSENRKIHFGANKGLYLSIDPALSKVSLVAGKTLDVSAGTLTLATGQIAGTKVANATPTTTGVVYLEPKQNLLSNTEWKVCHNGVLHEAIGLNTPVTDGANAALVNNMLTNGGFDSDTTGWTGTLATPSSAAGGKTGNGLVVTNDGAAIGRASQSVTTVIGKLYQFSVWFKKGTATGGRIKIGTSANGTQYYDSGTITDAGFTQYTKVITATSTTTHITLTSEEAATNTALYDSVTFYEVTPGRTDETTLATNWNVSTSPDLKLYREHNGTNTKDGSFYSMRIVSSTTGQYFKSSSGSGSASYSYELDNLRKLTGRTIAAGGWVKTSTASAVRLCASDNVTAGYLTCSAYHTGGGDWEWLEYTYTVPAAATTIDLYRLYVTNTTAFLSQPMLIYGNSIGAGNYSPQLGETIFLNTPLALTGYSSTTSAASSAIILEEATSGRIGKGVKAVYVKAWGKDSAAGDGVGFTIQGSAGFVSGITVNTQVNNLRNGANGWVPIVSNYIYFLHAGSGAAALTADVKIMGIELN